MILGKVMSIDNSTHTVNVEFFGDHTQDDISIDNCYLFSNDLMTKNRKKNNDLNKALKLGLLFTCFPAFHAKNIHFEYHKKTFILQELKVYITNIEHKYGPMHPAVGKVCMNGHSEQATKEMFPGAYYQAKTAAKG